MIRHQLPAEAVHAAAIKRVDLFVHEQEIRSYAESIVLSAIESAKEPRMYHNISTMWFRMLKQQLGSLIPVDDKKLSDFPNAIQQAHRAKQQHLATWLKGFNTHDLTLELKTEVVNRHLEHFFTSLVAVRLLMNEANMAQMRDEFGHLEEYFSKPSRWLTPTFIQLQTTTFELFVIEELLVIP